MLLFRSAPEAGKRLPGAVAAIGKFDGLHLGHQKIIRLALGHARLLCAQCLIVTFDPHPSQVLAPDPFRSLLTLRRKLAFFRKLGVDGVVLLPFTQKLACMAPEAFVRDILSRQLKIRDVYVGEDFCFGRGRAGRVETLEGMGPGLGFFVHSVPVVRYEGEKISASRIRRLIDSGDTEKAEKLLGRPLEGISLLPA